MLSSVTRLYIVFSHQLDYLVKFRLFAVDEYWTNLDDQKRQDDHCFCNELKMATRSCSSRHLLSRFIRFVIGPDVWEPYHFVVFCLTFVR